MGPDGNQRLPTRPKYSWDIKTVPWTDGIGDQFEYYKAVTRWGAFQDTLPDANPNRIDVASRGMVLQSNLYGRARDLCEAIDFKKINSEEGVDTILGAIYKRDPLSVVSLVFQELRALLSIKRERNEHFSDFEMRFGAQLSKFNSLGASVSLSGSIAALVLLAHADVDSSQRISILAAAAPSDEKLTMHSTTDEFIKTVKYETIASVLRQCDKPAHEYVPQQPLMAHAAFNGSFNRDFQNNSNRQQSDRQNSNQRGSHRGNPRNPRLTREQVQQRKDTSQCSRCGKFGHWYNDHNADGGLPNHVNSYDHPIRDRNRQQNSAPINLRHENDENQQDPLRNNGREDGRRNRSVSFNMARLTTSPTDDTIAPHIESSTGLGPMIDNGAPYSAIGEVELRAFQSFIGPASSGTFKLEQLPDIFKERPFWQYGTGAHASEVRAILGSVVIDVNAGNGITLNVRHLVLSGSSQWVFGRNITSKSNILQLDKSGMIVPGPDNSRITLPIIEYDMHIYLPISLFTSSSQSSIISALSGSVTTDPETICTIIDKVHNHVCGHAPFSDIRLLMQRNNIWSEAADKQLQHVISSCTNCRVTSKPQPARKVSLSSLSRQLNEVVCVDHFFLDGQPMMHIMDSSTRFSAAMNVPNTSLQNAIMALETTWLGQFWTPETVIGDDAFNHAEFTAFLSNIGSKFVSLPPRRHSKNVLESKHNIIRSIYLRLKDSSSQLPLSILAQQAVRCSNNLYGSNILSAFELAKGFTQPLTQTISPISDELIQSQLQLAAKRKLNLILSSKATRDINIQPGVTVDVYIKRDKEKRGKWSQPKTVLSFDPVTYTVTVPGANGRVIRAAIEDVRHSLPDNSLSQIVRMANDELDDDICELVSYISSHKPRQKAIPSNNSEHSQISDRPEHTNFEPVFTSNYAIDDINVSNPAVGDKIDVFWPLDNQYYGGVVNQQFPNGDIEINYHDGDVERLNMEQQTWRHSSTTSNTTPATSTAQTSVPELENTAAHSANSASLRSEIQPVLQSMFHHFGNQSFVKSKTQGFPSFPLINSYANEELVFKKTVKCVPVHQVPSNANVIGSHVIYKLKIEDDKSLKIKSRIAPHGNEDAFKNEMRSDCNMCSPVGMRLLLSISTVNKWKLSKLDVKSAFLQTGRASRDVYVIPPKESSDRGKVLWLLLAASYGLVNANAKWQVQSDSLLLDLGFKQITSIPQLFQIKQNGRLTCILAKIVDDIIITGILPVVEDVINKIDRTFKLGTVVHGPGPMRFFGINIIQHEDFSIETNGDDKLNQLEPFPLTRMRRKDIDDQLNPIERKYFASLNSSIGWLGITTSIFCAEFASRMQQEAPTATIKQLIHQINGLKVLKKLGTTIKFGEPKNMSAIRILVFSDAGRSCDNGQLCYIAGILFGEFQQNSSFHLLSWSSHKAKRPVRSIGAAEILAAGEAIDEGKILASTLSDILNYKVQLIIALDTKDLFTSLSTKRNSIDKSIRADVNVIRYEFECENVNRIIWIPGSLNLADPGTKSNSPLTEALQMLQFTGTLPIQYDCIEIADSNKPLG